MSQKVDDTFKVIHASLKAAGIKVSKGDRGIRARLESGYPVDIFTLKNSPDQIRARLKIDEPDPLKRQAYIESAQNSLSEALTGAARMDSFRMSRESAGVYIYNSVLEPVKDASGDEPIEICADAIEIMDSGDCDSEADDLAAFELDFGLEEETHIKVVKTLAETAVESLESVDAKMLRQSLDMMNLKRSSAVRLAVTRIFRSAMEVSELEKTIQNEAKRIVSDEDRAELQKVKALCANGFLHPVIDLLWQEVFQDAS